MGQELDETSTQYHQPATRLWERRNNRKEKKKAKKAGKKTKTWFQCRRNSNQQITKIFGIGKGKRERRDGAMLDCACCLALPEGKGEPNITNPAVFLIANNRLIEKSIFDPTS
jgi:hypothetical protein